MPAGVRSSRMISAFAALAVAAAGLVAPAAAQASGTPQMTLTITPTSVATGSAVELKASMPVRDDTGTVAQEIVQTIDRTKVRLTAASDIVAPQGWTLSYSFDSGATWTATTPTSATGTATSWDRVTAVKASGSLVTDGSDAGRQVATATVAGPVASLAPAALTTSTGDGYQVFFDPGRTRAFTVYHHKSPRTIDCWIIATGAKCAGFPFTFGLGADTSSTLNRSTARVVGSKVWISGVGGLFCVDISSVLANTGNTSGGGSPANCSTPKVALRATGQYSVFAGASTAGETNETKLYAVDGKAGGTRVSCVDTATMTACGEFDTGWGPSATPSLQNSESIVLWGNQVYVSQVKLSSFSPYTTRVTCFVVTTGQLCSGWSSPYDFSVDNTRAGGDMTWLAGGQLFALPNASGATRAICWARPTTRAADPIHCWTTSNTPADGMTAYNLPQFSAAWNTFEFAIATTQGTRVYVSDANYTATSPTKNLVYCYDAAANGGTGGKCNGRDLFSTVYNGYTATPDPVLPNCLWLTRHTPPGSVIVTANMLDDSAGCGSIAPVQVTFSGTTSVPRMGCSATNAIAQWQSFTLTSPTSGYTSLRLTIQDSSGASIAGWDDTVIAANSPVDLRGLSVATTGQKPNFIVRPVGSAGGVTATAQIKAVGDSPQLCLTPVSIAQCPTTSIVVPPSGLVAVTTNVVAAGSTTPGGSLPSDTEPLTIQAPLMSQCAGSLTGRAGTATLGTTGDAVQASIVTLLDDSGTVLRDDSNVPITATTDGAGNYQFLNLRPANYRVRFAATGTTSTGASAALSSVTVATGGSGTGLASAECGAGWTFDASNATCVRTVSATTANLGVPSGVTLSYLVVGGGGGGAAYSASGSRGGAGGQVLSGSAVVTGTVGATVGSGGGAASAGGTSTLTGLTGGTVTASGGAGGGGANPARSGTTSSITGTNVAYGADGPIGVTGSGGQVGTANRGNGGGGAWWTAGEGCYWNNSGPWMNQGRPQGSCGSGMYYYPGELQPAGAGGSGVVVLRYPIQMSSGSGTVPVGGAAIINALYIAQAVARPNTPTGAQGATQTISPLADDSTSSGATWPATGTPVKLCPVGTNPPCTATSVTVTGQGTYTANANGTVSFVPLAGFTGTATSLSYTATDSAGRTASSTLTPTVVARPTATNDTSSGPISTAQVITVRANDTAGAGTSLIASSIELCVVGTADATCDSGNLTGRAVSGQGVYTVDDTAGTVVFTPCGETSGNLVIGGTTYSTSCTGVPFTGTATAMKYIVKDGLGQIGSATITPTVTPPPPVTATADTSAGGQGVAQSVNPLTNDAASGGATVNATTVRLCSVAPGPVQTLPNCAATSQIVTGKGVYTVDTTTGVITFTPCNTTSGNLLVGSQWYGVTCTGTPFTGTPNTMTYQAKDNLNRVFSSTYTPTVMGAPTAAPNTSSGAFNTPQTITPLANDTASAGASLVPSSVRLCAVSPAKSPPNCDDTTVIVAGQGTYSVNPSTGVVTFTPLATFTGTATAMRYQVTDSVGQVANSTITATVSAPPAGTANPDGTSGTQRQAQTINPLLNDVVPGGVTLVGSSVRLCDGACDDTTVTVAGVGTYSVDAGTGAITFAPATGYFGTPPALSYRVTDSLGRFLTSTYTPTVVAPPTATPDTSTGAFGLPQTINLLGDDSADPSTALVSSSVKLCGPPSLACDDTTVDDTTGRYAVNTNGTVTFTPCTGTATPFASCTLGAFSGTISPLSYQVSDGLNQTATSTITVTVTPPASPTATDDTVTLKPGGTATFTKILGTGGLATPAEGNLASAYLCQVDDTTTSPTNETQTPPNCTATSVRTADGTWSIDTATGVVTYTNTSGVAGTQTPVTYQVNDTNGRSGSALLNPVITPPPTLNPDASRGERNQTQTIAPLGNDAAGSSSSPLDPSTIRLCLSGQSPPVCTGTSNVPAMSSGSQVGIFTVNASGTVTFQATSPTWDGVVDSLTYQVADSTGQVASSTITVTVLPPPAPTGVNDAISVAFGNPITFTPLTNDSAGTAPPPLVGAPSTNGSGVTSTTTTTWSSIAIDSSSLKLCGPGQSVPGCSATSVSTPDGTYTVSGTSVIFSGCADAGSPVQSPACAGPFLGSATQPVTYQFANFFMIDDSTVQTMPQSSMDGTTAAAGGWTLSGDSWTKTTTSSAAGIPQISSASIVPTITRVSPDAKNDAVTALVNRTVTINPLANDDSGSFPLNAVSIRLCDTGQTLAAGNCNATTVTIPGQGTFTLNGPAGTVQFTPLSNWTGAATMPYVITDSQGYADGATITVTVNAPIATSDDSYGLPGATQVIMPLLNDSAAAGTVTSLTASSLRLCGTGETVPDCSKTTLTTAKGTYSVNTTTGAVTFTPASTFLDGSDSVTYVVRDNLGEPASAVIRPNVVGPPSPLAADDTAYAPDGQPVSFTPWSNDTAMGAKTVGSITYTGGALAQASVRLCGAGDLAGSCDDTTVATAEGIYAVNTSTGVVTFTPAEGFTGTAAYPVTYEIANPYTVNAGSGSGTQIASARLIPVITTPPVATAADDTGAAAYGQSVTFSPWVNDSPMGDQTVGTVFYDDSGFTPTSVRLCGTGDSVPNCDDTTVITDDGTYVVNLATGQVTFTPAIGFSGPATPVRYQITDPYSISNGGTPSGSGTRIVSALLKPTIGPLTPPNADPDSGSGLVDDSVVLNPILNDDTGTLPLSLASLRLCDDSETAPACNSMTVAKIGQGTFVLDPATGLVTFTPTSGWHGVVSIPYVIADTQSTRAPSSLEVTITQPVMPTANDDAVTTAIDTPVTLPAATDDDSGTYPLNYSSVLLCGADDTAPACTQTSLTLTSGTFTVDPATGQVSFTPAPGWHGNVTVRYSVADTRGNRDSALLSVTIPAPAPSGGGGGGGGGGTSPPGGGGGGGGSPSPSPSPSPDPTPAPDRVVGRPGDPVRVDPIGNDSPGQGQVFDEGTLRLCPAGTMPPGCTGLVVQTDQGTWVVDPFTGAVTFTPVPGFEGLVEIPYVVETEAGEAVDSVISIWITDPPAAADDASLGRVDRPQTLDPWANDTHDAAPWDRGSLALCGSGQTPPGCDQTRVETPDGVYEIDPASGKVVFTPAPGFTGDATPLQYQVSDVAGQTVSAWLRPTVRGGSGGGGDLGWLSVRKVVSGNELRAGTVKIVTTCTGGGESMRKVHRLPVTNARGDWRVEVPAGMRCTVEETAHGAPKAKGVAPMWEDRRWAVDHAPTITVGESIDVGTAVPIDRLILSTKGGCEIRAGVLQAMKAGACVVTWRSLDGNVTTSTRWTHVGPRGTRVEAGTSTRAFPVRSGAETKVTFHNRYRSDDHIVTRTVYVTPECPTTAPKALAWTAPWASPQAMAAYAPRGGPTNPGTCPPRQ